jgi:BTB And C-terminal Kelch
LKCIRSDKFLSCSQSSLLRLLLKEKMTIDSELQLVQAAMNWAKVQNCGAELDPQSSKKLLGPCLEQLRMLALTPTEFSKYVASSGLFSSEDTLKILINLTTPGAMEMPEGLSTNTTQREGFGTKAVVSVSDHEIFCVRGIPNGSQKVCTVVKSPRKFQALEFKVNQSLFLTGLRLGAQTAKNKMHFKSYRENIYVSVYKADDWKKRVARQSYNAPVDYSQGFFDVMFSFPAYLMAENVYVLCINLKSRGTYLCKPRSKLVRFHDYKFTFTAASKEFPWSGIVHGLILEQ